MKSRRRNIPIDFKQGDVKKAKTLKRQRAKSIDRYSGFRRTNCEEYYPEIKFMQRDIEGKYLIQFNRKDDDKAVKLSLRTAVRCTVTHVESNATFWI